MSNIVTTKANSIVYLRDGTTSEFRAASFEVLSGKDVKGVSGDLKPRKSSRSYVAVFQTGMPKNKVVNLLDTIIKYLNRKRPLAIVAVGISTDGDKVEDLSAVALKIDTSEALYIEDLSSLKKSGRLPWGTIFLFGSTRHWKDALDDVNGVIREIKAEGLLRGHIAAPWGPLEIVERERGEVSALLVQSSRRGRYYDDDEDEDDDDDLLI